MKLLAFDTSTEYLSVATAGGAGGPMQHEGAGGAQASATLIPAIEALLARSGLQLGELDAIVFGEGPGAFTGLRTACAVAQGLGFAQRRPLLGIGSLLAVAEQARSQHGAVRVVAALDARMGEVYAAAYEWSDLQWHERAAPRLCAPAEVSVPAGWTLAGNALAIFEGRVPGSARVEARPGAAAMLRLAPAALAAGRACPAERAAPLYVRNKVAQTVDERAAVRDREARQAEMQMGVRR